MSSIFSKIIAGEIPCHKIAEDDSFIAFLDITPIREGHVLVVPKVEVDKIFDVNDDLLAKWLVFAKPVAKAIEKAFPCNRCGISVIGLEVPHAHMHLVPVDSADDLNFTREKLSVSQDDLKETRKKILAHL
ncbi:HIT family protein [Flavipsychrobacter stenotrophus]|uniref:HIT family protein n=1 Tax=Flavipsychrobacter stenotrophus TaxID=2077091 RepID=A0A2S7SPL3_9BACT|nr:HIT family protein [Flavipsychrobacter stenotrophus]PQJ08829.1 HIT family protein [Flavipsychrobacter stenotrophus]